MNKNFLEISCGSHKESEYLLDFSLKEGYLPKKSFDEYAQVANRIGAMLWGIISKL